MQMKFYRELHVEGIFTSPLMNTVSRDFVSRSYFIPPLGSRNSKVNIVESNDEGTQIRRDPIDERF